MQTAPFSVAITAAPVVNKQAEGSSKSNSVNKDEAAVETASKTDLKLSFKQAFKLALGQKQAGTGNLQNERNIAPDTDKSTETEQAGVPAIVDPDLTGMLSPALQAWIDGLPRTDSAAKLAAANAANVTTIKTEADGLSAQGNQDTTLPSVAAILDYAATLAQSDRASNAASSTTRPSAADATRDTAVPAFSLADLTADTALSVTTAAQNTPPTESLLAPSAFAAPTETAGSLATASPVATHIAANIETRAGSPEWDKAFSQQLVWITKNSSEGSSQSASLSLNPPELGPIKIVLHISDTLAYASFSSAQPEVRQMIENALPKLRDMLGETGLQLAQADINSGHPQQQQDDAASNHPSHPSQSAQHAQSFQSEPATDASIKVSTSTGSALVDIFA